MFAMERVNTQEPPRENSQEKLKVSFEKPGRKRKQKSILSGIEPKRLKVETPHVVLKPSRLKTTSETPVLPSGQFKQVTRVAYIKVCVKILLNCKLLNINDGKPDY